MIIYRKKFVQIAEAWFGEEPDAVGADIIRSFQREEPLAGALCRDFYTLLIDLTRDRAELLSSMRNGCRYKVRRAGVRDGISYDCANAAARPDLLSRFCAMYDEFATRKSLPALDRVWLTQMAETGGLFVSLVSLPAGDDIVWHTHYLSNGRATLLHSASPPVASDTTARNLSGRANRFQHWRDMLHFKDAGARHYDLGGWYQGDTDARRLGINRFKEEFGGSVVHNYITERALTARGKLFLRARTLLLGDAI